MAETYNYIAFGAREYVEEVPTPITMSRGRMFEYTPSEIERSLAGLDADAIAYLDQLPTFLCSEVIRSVGPRASVVIKYGHIEGTAADNREVSTRFITEIDFGEIAFETVDAAQQFLGLDPWQLYRTHWAVREGDAHAVLQKLAAAIPQFADAVALATAIGDAAVTADPPERARSRRGIANSVESFLGFLSAADPEAGTESFYRGHENWNFDLTPSLLRKHENGAWQYLPNEDRLCKELLIAHHEEFQNDEYRFDELVRMQHYGLPTRLLDITGNPLVALYFACVDSPDEPEGEVIIFRVAEDRVKYYDADTVSCIANLSKLTHEQKNDLDLRKVREDFNATPVAEKLLHYIRSEKGYFEGRIRPEDLGSILCVKAKRTNDRIKSQSGAFLLFGQDATLPETGQDGIRIERIGVTNKAEILDQLDRININATTVYPSIDRTALHLKTRYRVMPVGDA
jgi:hypothetical protein